ncbi:MAG: clostripain-related cysteine peptidase [Defluviitaleaceae bacterium]|nr:clostripain-related cysteine peptidase [Defluviitaleaceae bacterium]
MQEFWQKRRLTVLIFALIFAVGALGFTAANNYSAGPDLGRAIRSITNTSPVPPLPVPPSAVPYTIMVYMNGSDLESEFGAATDDLAEMLDSGLDSRNATVLILTGGAKRWQNDAIPETECIIWRLADGFLYETENLGKVNMGNPDTLRDFVKYGMARFPAQKFGLIMWDHGGGSIAGFGHDEKFNDAALTLSDMDKAFYEAGLADTKLEFLGFDACLMATVEMAVIASDYARVLIASEDLEPGEGWDYNFLSALNHAPAMDGFALGEIIVDSFIEFFENMGVADEEMLALSVIDLSKIAPVPEAMGRLMSRASSDLKQTNGGAFYKVAARRADTRTFGEGSPRDNYADMVDIGDMAIQLSDMYPREAADVLRALENCVTYNRHNSDVELHGLSTFYIYGGKSEGVPSLRTYSALKMNGDYTRFLHHFFDRLLRRHHENHDTPLIRTELVLWQPVGDEQTYRMAGLLQSPTKKELLWPSINGENVSLFPISEAENARRYAIPACVNNRDADIIVLFSTRYPEGKILGIRNYSGHVFQKGYDPITPGDEISFYRLETDFANPSRDKWHKSPSFIVSDTLFLTWETAPLHYKQGYRHTDICRNITHTPPF